MASFCPSMPDSNWLELALIRHGIADPRHGGGDHPERALTPRGRGRTRAVLAVLARRGVTLDRLLTSPYRRALQTAELAVEVGIAPRLERCDLLRPAESPLALVHRLQGRVGLVGHEPDLGQLACGLLGLMPGSLQLKKAGLVLLRRSEQRWQLDALLRPGLLLERPD